MPVAFGPISYRRRMKRVLITGMSGSGKSTVIRELRAMGFHAEDADAGFVVVDDEGFQVWDEVKVSRLLEDEAADILFFAGCEENMVDFLPKFDSIVLLSAPKEVLLRRVAERINNPFGKKPEERERIEFDIEHIEPRLRAVADVEINTDDDLELVLHQVLLLT